MTAQDALVELLERVGANHGEAVFVGAQELSEWPPSAVEAMKAQNMLVKARVAASIVCPGCERQCIMPIHIVPAQDTVSKAFVVCDKRSDINRVNVPTGSLEQWHASGQSVADSIARVLDLRRASSNRADTRRWEVGMFKGRKHASHLVLVAEGELKLTVAGHSIALADALEVKDDRLVVDRRRLVHCVDAPVGGAGDGESAEQRRDRLRARMKEEKARGTKAFLQVVAAEEGISPTRLKQLMKDKPHEPTTTKAWDGLTKRRQPPVSRAGKLKR